MHWKRWKIHGVGYGYTLSGHYSFRLRLLKNTLDNFSQIQYDQHRFGNVGLLYRNNPPETVRFARKSDARMPMVHGSWQRASRQNFVPMSSEKESLYSGLQIKFKGWGQMKMLLLALV